MSKHLLTFTAAILGCTCAVSAHAQTTNITVPNFSFEDGTTNNGAFPYGGLPNNYTFVGAGSFADPGAQGVNASNFPNQNTPGGGTGAPDGTNVLFINTMGASTGTITTAASLTTIAADTSYELTIAVGNPEGSGDFDQPGTAVISLLANGAVIPSATLSIAGETTIPDGSFEDFSVTLDAATAATLVGDDLTASIETIGNGNNVQGDFDNVRLTATVPEPSAWAAMIFGGAVAAGSVVMRRRKA